VGFCRPLSCDCGAKLKLVPETALPKLQLRGFIFGRQMGQFESILIHALLILLMKLPSALEVTEMANLHDFFGKFVLFQWQWYQAEIQLLILILQLLDSFDNSMFPPIPIHLLAWEQPFDILFFLHGKRKSPNTTGLPFVGTAISVPTVILWIRYNLHL
jgi:hypothetical protein